MTGSVLIFPFLGLKGGLENPWSVCLQSNECPLCCLRQYKGHTLEVWRIVLFMTWIQQQLPCGKPPLTGTSSPCLADPKGGQIVVPYFYNNLCVLSSCKNCPDVPCSESDDGPGWDDDHQLVGFQTSPVFTPKLHPISSWRSIFSQGRVVHYISCWRFCNTCILHEWVANPLHNPQPGGSRYIL